MADKEIALITDGIVNAEVVDDEETKPVKKKKPRKRMDIKLSQHYVDKFSNMTPTQVFEFVCHQIDAALILCKENILDAMEAVAEGEPYAVEKLSELSRVSATLAHEKAELIKVSIELGVINDLPKPTAYKAPDLSNEEWEKTFKPGIAISEPKQADLFTGPVNKAIN